MPRSAAHVRSNAPIAPARDGEPGLDHRRACPGPPCTGCSPAAALICEISLSGSPLGQQPFEPLRSRRARRSMRAPPWPRLADHGDGDDRAHHLARLLVVGQLGRAAARRWRGVAPCAGGGAEGGVSPPAAGAFAARARACRCASRVLAAGRTRDQPPSRIAERAPALHRGIIVDSPARQRTARADARGQLAGQTGCAPLPAMIWLVPRLAARARRCSRSRVPARRWPAARGGARDRRAHRGRHPRRSTTPAADPAPRPTAAQRLAWEVRQRTSVDTRLEPTRVRLDDPRVFETPLLYWSGDRAFAPLSEAEVTGLKRFVEFGGVGADRRRRRRSRTASTRRCGASWRAPSARARSRGCPARTPCIARSTCSSARSGRVRGPDHLEAVMRAGRAAVIYTRHDLGGALDRDNLGNYLHPVEPGGERAARDRDPPRREPGVVRAVPRLQGRPGARAVHHAPRGRDER